MSDDVVGQIMVGIKRMESGGNYRALNGGSGASGAYQFLDSTWGGYGGYRRAMDAPPEIQDARARQLMTAYYQRFGTPAAVAQAWLGGPGSVGKNVTDRYTGITSNQYVANVLSYAGMSGSGTNASGFAPDERRYMTANPTGLATPDTTTTAGPDLHDPNVQMQNLLALLENPPSEQAMAAGASTTSSNPADEVAQRMGRAS